MVVERVMVVVEVVAVRVPVRRTVAVMVVVGRVMSCLRRVSWCRRHGYVASLILRTGIVLDILGR